MYFNYNKPCFWFQHKSQHGRHGIYSKPLLAQRLQSLGQQSSFLQPGIIHINIETDIRVVRAFIVAMDQTLCWTF